MISKNNRTNAHNGIDHIFKDLFPAHGMAARQMQIDLSHQILDTMLDGKIALCDAGTGIGKPMPASRPERCTTAAVPRVG